jgi:hypothetical protein
MLIDGHILIFTFPEQRRRQKILNKTTAKISRIFLLLMYFDLFPSFLNILTLPFSSRIIYLSLCHHLVLHSGKEIKYFGLLFVSVLV